MNCFEEQEYSKKLDISVFIKLVRFALPYKKYLLALGIQMLLIAGVDAIFPLLSKYAIDTFIIPHSFNGFPLFCVFILALSAAQSANVFVLIRVSGKMDAGIPYDIRKAAFQKLQELSLAFFDKTPTGWIMARMTSDVKRIGNVLSWNLVDLIWALCYIVLMAVVMLIVNWKLALIVCATVPVLVAVSFFFQQLMLKNYRKVRKTNSNITNSLNEGIMGAKTIKTLVRERDSLNEFSGLTAEMRKYSVRAAVVSSVYTPMVILLGSLGTAALIWRGGYSALAGSISFGTLVAFLSYSMQFFEPVKQFARISGELQYAQASAERILSLIDIDSDIKDSKSVENEFGHYLEPQINKWPEIRGDISFQNVSFSYKSSESVLKNFSMDIRAGETIAIVGETGAGKSTIVNLICRFYEPTAGEIHIDGVEYRKRPLLWLHSNLGYVLQDAHLFSGTVRENIAYTETDASMEDIINAAKLVNAHDFIIGLEKGYETDVGERGGKLSTGQKQLISFARAILANPRIFIFDEATSSVDTETEHLIKDAIQNILSGRTSFIIAHRLSTIRSADRILVIDKGRIIEEGSHSQLIKQKGHYYRLYTNQLLKEHEQQLLDGSKKAVLMVE